MLELDWDRVALAARSIVDELRDMSVGVDVGGRALREEGTGGLLPGEAEAVAEWALTVSRRAPCAPPHALSIVPSIAPAVSPRTTHDIDREHRKRDRSVRIPADLDLVPVPLNQPRPRDLRIRARARLDPFSSPSSSDISPSPLLSLSLPLLPNLDLEPVSRSSTGSVPAFHSTPFAEASPPTSTRTQTRKGRMTVSATLPPNTSSDAHNPAATATAPAPGPTVPPPIASPSPRKMYKTNLAQSPVYTHALGDAPSVASPPLRALRSPRSPAGPDHGHGQGGRGKGNAMRRVQSQGSTASAGTSGTSAALHTPSTGDVPLGVAYYGSAQGHLSGAGSSSGLGAGAGVGSGTDKTGRMAVEVDMDGTYGGKEGPVRAEELSDGMGDRQMLSRSPEQTGGVVDGTRGIVPARPYVENTGAGGMDHRRDTWLGTGMGSSTQSYGETGESSHRKLPSRTWTNSTDSSESATHPRPPSQLGSSYTAEGFARPASVYQPYGFTVPRTDSPEMGLGGMTPAAAAAVAAADEAIKQLNGTSSVFQGLGGQGRDPAENSYQLPRGFANFVRPQARAADSGVTRQSSMSSATTEASTSSEEEDLCVPSIEWVQRGRNGKGGQHGQYGQGTGAGSGAGQGQGGVSGASPGSGGMPGWLYTPHLPQLATGQDKRLGQNGKGLGKMPPPALVQRMTSPRYASMGPSGQPAPPNHPTGQGGHPLSAGALMEAPDDDDDDQTVGHRDRERSPSSSSQSAQSGLDLLWRAVTRESGSESTRDDRGDNTRDVRPAPPVPAGGFDTKGKRKAGAEAVAQWRQSGIPVGVDRLRRGSTTSTEPSTEADADVDADMAVDKGREGADIKRRILSPPPHKKRRRSSAIADEAHAQAKRDMLAAAHAQGGAGAAVSAAGGLAPPHTSGDADWESEPDDGESEGDSEYGGPAAGKPRRSSAARGRGSRKGAAGASRAGPRGSVGSASAAGAGGKGGKKGAGGAGGAGVKKEKDKDKERGGSPAGSGAGAGAGFGSSKPRVANTVHVPAGGVQCEYVNPLPPYNRCQDVFTRKYDLPRHMARHARREGELVLEGTLLAEQATLWATIKDKPKVTCEHCGESFTRMDALKRHQAKQHH